jgi:hypothetical protein
MKKANKCETDKSEWQLLHKLITLHLAVHNIWWSQRTIRAEFSCTAINESTICEDDLVPIPCCHTCHDETRQINRKRPEV